jgi:hypothetical protein
VDSVIRGITVKKLTRERNSERIVVALRAAALPRNPIPALMSLKQILGSFDRLTNPNSENARDFLLSSASFFFLRVLYFEQAAVVHP